MVGEGDIGGIHQDDDGGEGESIKGGGCVW